MSFLSLPPPPPPLDRISDPLPRSPSLLRRIVSGDQELTLKSVADTNAFPLLDSFHWEILRLFPAPPFFFKEAKMDLVAPTSSGQKYQVFMHARLRFHPKLSPAPRNSSHSLEAVCA